jgi:hypothetical protein
LCSWCQPSGIAEINNSSVEGFVSLITALVFLIGIIRCAHELALEARLPGLSPSGIDQGVAALDHVVHMYNNILLCNSIIRYYYLFFFRFSFPDKLDQPLVHIDGAYSYRIPVLGMDNSIDYQFFVILFESI